MATIDDLESQLERMNATLERMAQSQSQFTSVYSQRLQARHHIFRAVGSAFRGNWRGVRSHLKQAGRAWLRGKGFRGFGGNQRPPKPRAPKVRNPNAAKTWHRNASFDNKKNSRYFVGSGKGSLRARQLGKSGGFSGGGFMKGGGRVAAGAGAASVIGAVVVALYMFKKAVEHATDAAVEAARRYAQVSPSQGAAVAERDVREMLREREKGERTSGTMRMVLESEQYRKDQQVEYQVLGENIKNLFTSAGNEILGGILEPINDIIGIGNKILTKLGIISESDFEDLGDFALDMERRGNEGMAAKTKALNDLAEQARRAREKGVFPR